MDDLKSWQYETALRTLRNDELFNLYHNEFNERYRALIELEAQRRKVVLKE